MAVGHADIVTLLRSAAWKRQRVHIFAVIPVEEKELELETKICAARCAVERSGACGEILLADAGADENTRRMCENVFDGVLNAEELIGRIERLTGKSIERGGKKSQ